MNFSFLSNIDCLQKLVGFANMGVIFALALSFLFGGASIILGARLKKTEGENFDRYKTKNSLLIESAKADTEQARLETQEIKKQNLELQLLVEEEKMARIKLEEKVAWRRLTKDQKEEISSRLSRFTGQPVTVSYSPTDHEGMGFALDIVSTLRLAGWKADGPTPVLEFINPKNLVDVDNVQTGVVVGNTENKESQAASEALGKRLIRLGFDAYKAPRNESGDKPMVSVRVFARPEGPQGRAKLDMQKK